MIRGRDITSHVISSLLVLLTGCNGCQTAESERKQIAGDGTTIYTQVEHCSAISNSVRFYLDIPKVGTKLIGEGSDLEEFGQAYDDRRREITLFTSDVAGTTLIARRIGPFSVRVSAIAPNVVSQNPSHQVIPVTGDHAANGR